MPCSSDDAMLLPAHCGLSLSVVVEKEDGRRGRVEVVRCS